jgi:redox-sensitive bicupin YhaK (pirin superfamily)
MITIRPSNERGHANHGWLDTYHTFSFADYHDPAHVHFRTLRVINEDRVAPAQGFGTHPHRDMEIITYVLDGALEHKDSTGGGGVIRPGMVQAMSAGTGVTHSEFNHSKTDEVHLLQIWILPERKGLQPRYEEKTFAPDALKDTLRLIASRDGRDGAITVFQDVELFASRLGAGKSVEHKLGDGRHAWLQVARGALTLNNTKLRAGDGAAVTQETALKISANEPSEFLLFDLA